MFRLIRRGIVTTLAIVVLIAPMARAQTDAVKKQLLSAIDTAETLKKQGMLPEAAREYEQALDLARRATAASRHQITAAVMMWTWRSCTAP